MESASTPGRLQSSKFRSSSSAMFDSAALSVTVSGVNSLMSYDESMSTTNTSVCSKTSKSSITKGFYALGK